MNERELIKSARTGDFKAFNQLISGHKDRIYRLALRLTGNRDDAEDIVQETFLKAIDNIEKFREEATFGTWLYTIALNLSRAEYTDRRKMDLMPIEDYLPDGHSSGQGTAELFDWGDPHNIMEKKELQEYIHTELNNMPIKYSLPFSLRYIEDLPVKEVAELLSLSIPAAKSRILRARLALRDTLAGVFKEYSNEKM